MSLRSILIGGGGGNENYVVNNITNYYTSIDGNSIGYDDAGNMTADKDGYKYYYDYENRLVKVTKSSGPEVTVAEYAYDALGRRIRKIDSIGSETTLYYYNNNWQVVTEADSAGDTARYFVYGNFVDEAVMVRNVDSGEADIDGVDLYYVHDHLYSTRALLDEDGFIVERTTYDVYGNAKIRPIGDINGDGYVTFGDVQLCDDLKVEGASGCDPNYRWSADVDNDGDITAADVNIVMEQFSNVSSNQPSYYRNSYYFTGRRLDTLDNSCLKLQYNRNRYYNSEIGRWLTRDPLGITPEAERPNRFSITNQYKDGLNIYSYVNENPVTNTDPYGLWGERVHYNSTYMWSTTNSFRHMMVEWAGKELARGDLSVDSGSTSPVTTDESALSWHFNMPPDYSESYRHAWNANDSRFNHSEVQYNLAIELCQDAIGKNIDEKKDIVKEAVHELGKGLHAVQDWVAHGSWIPKVTEYHWSPVHPKGSDDVLLDFAHSTDNMLRDWHHLGGEPAKPYFKSGMNRYSKTRNMSLEYLNRFKNKCSIPCKCLIYQKK